MPNLKTSIKDLRQNKRRNTYNNRLRNRVKKSIKRFETLTQQGNIEEANKALRQTSKVLDKAAKKNVIKEGNASRKKSRLATKLNILSANNVETTKKSN